MIETILKRIEKNKISYKQVYLALKLLNLNDLTDLIVDDPKIRLLLLSEFDNEKEIKKTYCKILLEDISDEEIDSLSGADLVDMHSFFFDKFLKDCGLMKRIEQNMRIYLNTWNALLKEISKATKS